MATGNLNVAMILKLVDQVSGPAAGAVSALRGIGAATEQAGRAGVAWSNEQLAANQARMQGLQSQALGIAATGYAFYQALKPAIEFESAMAGVSKVVDFDSPDGLAQMQEDILAMTTSGALPIAAEGIAAIIEAAGQAGVVDSALPDDEERAQLIAFARDAAQMGVAFDISAEQSGASMAQWRKAMGLSQSQALGLGDAINHLSNNMNASAPDLVEIIRRQGAVAQSAGLAEVEIAALSAAFLSGGASPEVAATGMKNFLGALTAGEAMTARQSAVMQTLGFDAVELSQRMQVDAKGAIIEVMEALSELPAHAQGASLSQLFGEESKGAIAPLLNNITLVSEALGLVGDESLFAGSMLEEYAKQSETTANALNLTKNYVTGLSIAAGSILLPELNQLLATVQPVISMITQWAEAHPELISLIAKLAAGILVMKVASLALRWTLFSALTPILHLIRAGSWLLMILPMLGRGILALLNPMKLVRGAMIALRYAFIASGIGAILVGVAMAGVWIYNNWSGLKSFFTGFWVAFREALGPAAPMLDGIIESAKSLWTWFTNLLGPLDANAQTWTGWGTAAGTAIGGVVTAVMNWTGVSSELITTIAGVYGGFLALRLIWKLPLSPLRLAGRAIGWIAKGPLIWAMRAVGLLSRAFLRLGIMVMANPIGLVIASVAALAFVVYQNWDKIVAYFTDKVEVIRAAFDEGLLQGVLTSMAELNPFTLMTDVMKGLVVYVMDLLGVPDEITTAFSEFSLWDTGVNLLQSLWDGMASIVENMTASISAKIASLKPQWLTDLQNWVGGDDSTSAEPGRDRGGPVRAGVPYMVGEREPELFVPGVSGSILPARAMKAAMAASMMAAPAAAAPNQAEILQSVDQRPAISAPASGQQIIRQGDQICITVQAAPGMDAAEVAREVERQLARRADARRGDLHDGGMFE
ncbi:phage tail tape measure protein [Halocynthiibacter namhaensis]|uniref:phage tail tape measure protein n=2 Tax=Halocynthiibacter namhaensis TaxID=1290553 RepID=UPI00068BFDDB|nr:phage tail tape measure protein [Halocynthiibacter namhaensis]